MECVFPYTVRWVDRASVERMILPKETKRAAMIGTITGAATAGAVDATAVHGPETAWKPIGVTVATVLGGGMGFIIGHIVDKSGGEVIYKAP